MSPSTRSMRLAKSAMFSRLPVEKLSRMRTASPRAISARAIDEPMKPAPPVTRYRPMASDSPSESPVRRALVLAGVGGEAADEVRQRRIADLVGQRCERNRRVAHLAAPGRVDASRRCRQRPDREPGRHEKSRNDPEEPSCCRHAPTLSHPPDMANFSPLASILLA